MTAFRGGRADRVPVSLYEMTHLSPDSWAAREPSYRPLLDLQRELGESFLPAGANIASLAADHNSVRDTDAQGRGTTTDILRTPRGDLTEIRRREKGQMTSWQVKPLIENADDARKFLSIPVEDFEVDPSQVHRAIERAGDEAMVLVGPGDPLGRVAGMFHFDGFIMMLIEHEDLVLEMLRVTYERMRHGLEQLCSAVAGVAIRFWGPEYAGAPMMNPKVYFPKLVTDFTGPLVELVNESGNFSVIHAHGRLDDVLEMIAEMNPHVLEPLEVLPASTADVTMAGIKSRIGDSVCLMGGLQANELENGTPQEVRSRVEEICGEAKEGGGFVLIPTSTPISVPLEPRIVDNYRAYFHAGREFGTYR